MKINKKNGEFSLEKTFMKKNILHILYMAPNKNVNKLNILLLSSIETPLK